MSENIDEYRLKFLLENYKILREEILESIVLQNRIIMGVGTAIGVILGFGLTKDVYSALIMSIPFIVSVLTSWWLVEQSRMMRAGDFLQHLEDLINFEVGGTYVTWENWLRTGSNGSSTDIHHFAQYICVIGIFYGISIISFSLFFIYDPLVTNISISVRLIFTIFPATILGILIVPIIKIIRHKSASKEDFKRWLCCYGDEINKICGQKGKEQ